MAKPMVNLYSNLEHEFESLQKSLTDIDTSIRKVTGKDPAGLYENKPSRGRIRSSDGNRRGLAFKRSISDIEEKDDDHANKTRRSLQSQVVATSWETKQRNQVLEEQKNDMKSMSRNKRMFGLILGTLEKFKSEESQRRDSKREEIEKKLDRADEQEREEAKKERIELFKQRKMKRIQLKCLEQKLQCVEVHKEWEKAQQFIGNFIETKAKPGIFYMPTKHNSETQKRLQETKDKYRIIFAEKRAKVQKELNEIEENYKIDLKFSSDDKNEGDDTKDDEFESSQLQSDSNNNNTDNNNANHDKNKNADDSRDDETGVSDTPMKREHDDSYNSRTTSEDISENGGASHNDRRQESDDGEEEEEKVSPNNELNTADEKDFEPMYE